LGVNIVKTNDGPEAPPCGDEEILADFERSASLLHRHAGYLALSLSCPNVKGGRDFFAQPGNIARLLARLRSLPVQCPGLDRTVANSASNRSCGCWPAGIRGA
jgi:dihydroorotate dehydrogenase (fumarate)/dihydroorotate dehydrogenase